MQILIFYLTDPLASYTNPKEGIEGRGGFAGVKKLDPYCFDSSGYLKEFVGKQLVSGASMSGEHIQFLQLRKSDVLVETWHLKSKTCVCKEQFKTE